LRKILICEVAVLNFSKFSEKTQKHVPRITFSLSIRFCSSPTAGILENRILSK